MIKKIQKVIRSILTPCHKIYEALNEFYETLEYSNTHDTLSSIVMLVYGIYFFIHNGINILSIIVGAFEIAVVWLAVFAIAELLIKSIKYINRLIFGPGNRIYENLDNSIKREEQRKQMEAERRAQEERQRREAEDRKREEERRHREEERRAQEEKRRRDGERRTQEEKHRREEKRNSSNNKNHSSESHNRNTCGKPGGTMEYNDAIKLFGLNDGFTEIELKKAQRRLLRKYHPDNNPGKEEECTRMTKKINAAYGLLRKTFKKAA